MEIEAFIDTNILIYAVAADDVEPEKSKVARALLLEHHWAWSVQVAQEFYVNVTRERHGEQPLSHKEACMWIQAWDHKPMQENTKGCLAKALEWKDRFQLSLWDANILAASSIAGAPLVFTEDLNHRQKFEDVQVINPFRND